MAITTTLAPQFEDALITALRARANLTDAQVVMGPPGDMPAGDYIFIATSESDPITSDEEFGVLGNIRRRERISIQCLAQAYRAGAGEDAIRAVRDAVHDMLAEVAEELRTAAIPGSNHALLLSGKAKQFELSAWSERRGATGGQRWSQIPFTITYLGDLPTT